VAIVLVCCAIIVLGAVGYRQASLASCKGRCIFVPCVCWQCCLAAGVAAANCVGIH